MQTTLVLIAAALFAGGVLLDAQIACAGPAAAAPAPMSTPTGTAAEEARLLAQAARPYRSGARPQ